MADNDDEASVVIVDMQQAEHLADEVIGMRLTNQTKKHYEGHLVKMKRWLLENNHVDSLTKLDVDNLPIVSYFRLPLQEEVIKAYLGAAQRMDRNLQQVGKYYSASTMQSICSSISYIYRVSNMPITPSTETMMQNFMRGYKRRVSELKQSGQMAIFEGKRPISSRGFIALATFALT
jgi:hypothetical protein